MENIIISHKVEHNFVKKAKDGMIKNTYILFPQKPVKNKLWSAYFDDIKGLIDNVVEEKGISSRRISIAGFSQGADAITDIIGKYNNFFSSAVMILLEPKINSGANFSIIPTLIFYIDSEMTGSDSNNFADNLSNKGLEVHYKALYNQSPSNIVENILNLNQLNFDDNYNYYGNITEWMISKLK